MPGKLKVRILAGRNLPIMDRSTDLTDAFVEIKFSSTVYKTDVFRKSLNPHWNSEWYRFEVDDEDLQDQPLELRVLDHDTYSAHDAIGKVYIDLNPLLSKDPASAISGWFPLFDTMHGIRGELQVIVKIELFSDFNKFRQSSCGVRFFCSATVPYNYRVLAIHGFVEELVVNDDPEYQWIDKIRTQRASNEARQRLFSKLSGELQRKIGLKVLEMGGNAVIGYHQCFDLEGESGSAVVRAIGTAVTLLKLDHSSASPGKDVSSSNPSISTNSLSNATALFDCPSSVDSNSVLSHMPVDNKPRTSHRRSTFSGGERPSMCSDLVNLHKNNVGKVVHSVGRKRGSSYSACSFPLPEDMVAPSSPTATTPIKNSPPSFWKTPTTGVPYFNRRSSDSDLQTPPRAGSFTGSSGSGSGGKTATAKPVLSTTQHQSVEILEYPFFTIKTFPPGFLIHLAGVVSTRSVKLLDRIHNPDEPETRDAWWTELRLEIRSHAQAMGCHAVVGYREHTKICDEIIILSATGTAATVNISMDAQTLARFSILSVSMERQQLEKSKEKELETPAIKSTPATKKLLVDVNLANDLTAPRFHHLSGGSDDQPTPLPCSICHVPYNENSAPFPVCLSKCAVCRRHKVPDVLFTTIEPPVDLPIVGRGCFIQARICRPKKEAKGETNAKEISDTLPFMEYELHSQLINKLKVKGMNSLFGLHMQVAVGDKMLVAVATATAVYAAALPPPPVPVIAGKGDMSVDDRHLQEIQKKMIDTVTRNKDVYNLYPSEYPLDQSPRCNLTDEDEEEVPNLDLLAGNKDTFVLEVDDAEDVSSVTVLIDAPFPDGFDVCNTERMPGVSNLACNIQMFTRMWRGTLTAANNRVFSTLIENVLRSMFFKLRQMVPCVLCDLDFDIELPDADEIQVCITGMCVGVGEPPTAGLLVTPISRREGSGSSLGTSADREDMMFPLEEADTEPPGGHVVTTPAPFVPSIMKGARVEKKMKYYKMTNKSKHGVDVSPLAFIPGGRIEQYLGQLNFFMIRESTSVREDGGLNGFIHSFTVELLSIVRSHVAALGGNALVSYQMGECILDDNLNKNQAQCLVNVYGDVVLVVHDSDVPPLLAPPSIGDQTNKDDDSTVESSKIS